MKLNVKEIEIGFKDVPSVEVKEEINLVDLLVLTKAAQSKREARTFIQGGGVYVNGDQVKDIEFMVKKENGFDGKFTIIRRGKKNYYLIKH